MIFPSNSHKSYCVGNMTHIAPLNLPTDNDQIADYFGANIDKITTEMVPELLDVLEFCMFEHCAMSSALMNGRMELIDAGIAHGWQPSREFVYDHIPMVADALRENPPPVYMRQVSEWLNAFTLN